MKYKALSLATIAALLTVIFFAQGYQPPSNRYHQHLEAAPKSSCTNHGDETFCTHLPLMNITTDGPIPSPYLLDEDGKHITQENGLKCRSKETVSAAVAFFDSSTENNHLTDVPAVQESAVIRIRGNSSLNFDKKGYLLKFKDKTLTENKDVSLAGMTADSDWVLHGPIMDRTLIRNYLCYNLAGEIMEYSPNVRFMELFLNGEYMGVYLLVEKINYNDDGRVNITQTDPKMAMTSFILRLDSGDTDELHQLNTFYDFSGKRGVSERWYDHFEICYPSATLTKEQKQYITYAISAFEKALTSFDASDGKMGYPAYIDVDSFVNYWILNEFIMNVDAGRLSTYFAKDIRGKLKIIGWDYNNVFDNYILETPHSFYIDNIWYLMLMRNKEFVDLIVDRYYQLRESYFSDAYLINYIDETVAYLGDAINRNYEKWGYCFDLENVQPYGQDRVDREYLIPLSRNPESYEESLQMLKSTIVEHGKFLDKNIESLYAHCHNSANKQFRLQD